MTFKKEFKIGFILLFGAVVFYWGGLFLKNKGFGSYYKLYAIHSSIEGLKQDMPVYVNGLNVGRVVKITPQDVQFKNFVIELSVLNDYHIPKNSLLTITPSVFGSATLSMRIGDAPDFCRNEDTILMNKNTAQLGFNDVLNKTGNLSDSAYMLIHNVNEVLEQNIRKNLIEMVNNFTIISRHVKHMAEKLDSSQHHLSATLKNMNAITHTLNQNSQRISDILQNMHATSEQMKTIPLKNIGEDMEKTMKEMKKITEKINTKDGSLGLLVHDKKLYDNFESTLKSMQSLINDIQKNPKKYINVSVFGKVKKNTPMPDTTHTP